MLKFYTDVHKYITDHQKYFSITRCVLIGSKCIKTRFGWDSALDPAGGTYDAPKTPKSDGKGAPPLHFPPLDDFGVFITGRIASDRKIRSRYATVCVSLKLA